MEELVWRKGNERCERSYKEDHPQYQNRILGSEAHGSEAHGSEAHGSEAHGSEAHGSEAHGSEGLSNSNELRVGTIADDGFHKVSTKREEANFKMNERYLIGQAIKNPFMTPNNYVNDLEVQMNFLTPQKSNL